MGATALLTTVQLAWLGASHPTIAALSYLLVVLLVASVAARWVAITTSFVVFVCFNYYFLPPVGTFVIADPVNWVALFALLAVSIVASHLSSQARRRADEATARRDELARLFDLTRDILLTTDAVDAVGQLAGGISRRFGLAGVTICLPAGDGWSAHRSDELALAPDRRQLDDALAADRHAKTSVAGKDVWMVPLRSATQSIGVLVLHGDVIEAGTRDAIAGVAAIAIERTTLLEDRKEAEVVRREAEVKSALLASLSHDLKTPLTAVTVAANNLNASWLGEAERHEQAEIVRVELDRLNRLFDNIVEMARIETDAVSAELEWVHPVEIVEAAAGQVQHALVYHRLEIHSPSEPTLVKVDPRLTSAALAHVLENAAQYSPRGSTVTVDVAVSPLELTVSIRDHGAGVAAQDAGRLFDHSYRGAAAGRQRFGTGMGLAITRGLLAAQRGRIRAQNHPDGGAVFTIVVPVESRATPLLETETP